MTETIAKQIAVLINSQNELAIRYTSKMVLAQAGDHLWEMQGERVIGAVRIQCVQWYQAEISHLSVHSDVARIGIGTKLLKRAEVRAAELGARIAQCTIRESNERSIKFFTKHGFASVTSFSNPQTGNIVKVFQRSLTT